MLEVVLGLGLIALGLVVMVGLVPAGLKTNREAFDETQAAYSAEQLVCFLSARLTDPSDGYENWDDYGLVLPTSKPGPTEPTSGWTDWLTEDTVCYSLAGSNREYYRSEHGDDGTGQPDAVIIYRLWRDSVTLVRDDGGSTVTTTLPTDEALAVYIEASWPAHQPYATRETAVYHFEVFKP